MNARRDHDQKPPGKNNRFYLITILFFTFTFAYLTYLIIKPFLVPIAWAIVLSVVFYPVYIYIRRYIKWKSIASALTLFIVVAIIIGPFSYLAVNLARELKEFANFLNTTGTVRLEEWLKSPQVLWVQERIVDFLNLKDFDLPSVIMSNLAKFGRSLGGNITKGVANIFLVFVNFAVMVFAMFFILRDAPDFMVKIRDYLPFSDEQKNRLESQVKDMVISTIYGGVVVAIIQGILGGITFFLLGLKSPVLLGTAIGFMSFIPGLGAASVWVPVMGYLFITGSYAKAVILLIVGTLVISMVDNILKPIIISGRTKMHMLIIFFSVVGGLNLFGLLGLILGPLAVALFVSVLEIFRKLEENHEVTSNPPETSNYDL